MSTFKKMSLLFVFLLIQLSMAGLLKSETVQLVKDNKFEHLPLDITKHLGEYVSVAVTADYPVNVSIVGYDNVNGGLQGRVNVASTNWHPVKNPVLEFKYEHDHVYWMQISSMTSTNTSYYEQYLAPENIMVSYEATTSVASKARIEGKSVTLDRGSFDNFPEVYFYGHPSWGPRNYVKSNTAIDYGKLEQEMNKIFLKMYDFRGSDATKFGSSVIVEHPQDPEYGYYADAANPTRFKYWAEADELQRGNAFGHEFGHIGSVAYVFNTKIFNGFNSNNDSTFVSNSEAAANYFREWLADPKGGNGDFMESYIGLERNMLTRLDSVKNGRSSSIYNNFQPLVNDGFLLLYKNVAGSWNDVIAVLQDYSANTYTDKAIGSDSAAYQGFYEALLNGISDPAKQQAMRNQLKFWGSNWAGGISAIDNDNDGFVEGVDADDNDPFVNPITPECYRDGIDNDGNGYTDELLFKPEGETVILGMASQKNNGNFDAYRFVFLNKGDKIDLTSNSYGRSVSASIHRGFPRHNELLVKSAGATAIDPVFSFTADATDIYTILFSEKGTKSEELVGDKMFYSATLERTGSAGSSYPAWKINTTYFGGDTVFHNDTIWVANYYNENSEPKVEQWAGGAWKATDLTVTSTPGSIETPAAVKTVSVSINNPLSDSTSPYGSVYPAGTVSVAEGDSLVISVLPSVGNIVEAVYLNGVSVEFTTDMYGGIATYTVQNVVTDMDVKVQFATEYRIVTTGSTVEANNTLQKTYFVADGAALPLSAPAAFGALQFQKWNVVSGSATFVNSTATETYITNISSDAVIEAVYSDQLPTFTLTGVAADNGTISPLGETVINEGESVTYTFTPNKGYEVAQVTVNGSTVNTDGLSYTFTNVTADQQIVVYFKPATRLLEFDRSYIGSIQWLSQDCDLKGDGYATLGDIVNISISDSIDEVHRFVEWRVVEGTADIANPTAKATTVTITGNAKILPVLKRVHAIEAIAGNSDGIISNVGTKEYDEGTDVTFDITPNVGFEIAEVRVDGEIVTVVNNQFTFTNVTTAHQIVVYFKPAVRLLEFDRSYIGSIQWLSQDCDLKGHGYHKLGDIVNISISDSIDEVHRFVEWRVVEGSAEIANPTARATTVKITGNAKILPVLKRVHEIEAHAGNTGGSISGEGVNEYDEGKSAVFTITPDKGYEIAELQVDGVKVPVTGLTYTFDNVQEKHLIVVYFKQAIRSLQFDLDYIGSIQWLYQDCNLQGNGYHKLGDIVTISINDSINETHRFVRWELKSGTAVIANPTATSTTVEIQGTEDIIIEPVLELIPVGPQYEEWSSTKSYGGGSKVSYNGKNWEAKWWTQGSKPGVADVWKEI